MPRTKRVSKKKVSTASSVSSQSSDTNELIMADIKRAFDTQMAKLDKELENSLESLRRAYDVAKLQIPKNLLDVPYRQDEDEETISLNFSPEVTSSSNVCMKTKCEDICSPKKAYPNTVNKMCTKNSSKGSNTADRQLGTCPRTLNRFRTPACNVGPGGKYNLITPKVQPNSVLSILRRPREGEMILSMSGSPLLVSSVTHDSMANVNVPLPNGSVMSILPQAGLRPHDLPNMDSETYQQLKQLKDNLASILKEPF